MLVVALVGRDEGKRRNLAGGQIAVEGIEAHHVVKAAARFQTLLNAGEVHKWIVLGRVQRNDVARSQGRGESWLDRGEIRQVREVTVADVDSVGASGRQALLVAFPSATRLCQLIGNRFAHGVGSS